MSKNVARGTMLGIAGQAWQLVTALFLYAFLARRFGPAAFGSWTVVLSVLAWFEIFVVSGVVKVTTKAISEADGERDAFWVAAYLSQLCLAAGSLAAILILAGPISVLLGNPSLAPLLRVAALDIPLFGLLLVASSIVLGAQRFERQGVAWIVYATAKASLIATFVLLGFGVTGALVGNALASLVGFSAMFIPLAGKRGALDESWTTARWMLVAAVPFLTLALIEGFGQSVDLWIVSGMVPSVSLVGFYASATVLAEIPVFLFLGLNRVIFPSVASARSTGDHERADRYTRQAVRLALIVTVMGVAFIAATGKQVITLIYSVAYLPAFIPVLLLMVAGMGRTIRAACTEVLMAADRRRAALTALAVTVVLEVVLVVAFTARWGINGAAAGTALSALVAGAWGMLLLRSSLGPRPLGTLARSVVAGAAVTAVLWFLVPPPTTSTPLLIVAVAAALAGGSVVYFAGLWLLGEFGPDDIASLKSALGR